MVLHRTGFTSMQQATCRGEGGAGNGETWLGQQLATSLLDTAGGFGVDVSGEPDMALMSLNGPFNKRSGRCCLPLRSVGLPAAEFTAVMYCCAAAAAAASWPDPGMNKGPPRKHSLQQSSTSSPFSAVCQQPLFINASARPTKRRQGTCSLPGNVLACL